MRFRDNPFLKTAYGDWKTVRNCLEVSAIMLAARKLRIRAGLVHSAGHNYYIYTELQYQAPLLIEACKLTEKEVKSLMHEIIV